MAEKLGANIGSCIIEGLTAGASFAIRQSNSQPEIISYDEYKVIPRLNLRTGFCLTFSTIIVS